MTRSLELHNIEKRYTAPDGTSISVLQIANLTLERGEELALAGPSGSGKTTLLHLASGLLVPSTGEVRVLDTTISAMPEARRDLFRAQQIGYIFQRPSLLDGFTALENVLLPMEFAGVIPSRDRRRHAQALLEHVGLHDRLNYRPAQLSSGQQQRVAVARAIANTPSLVLADEPTASVDQVNGKQILSLIRQFCAERNAALLFVSHDQTLLNQFRHVVTLRQGRIEQQANLETARSREPEAGMVEIFYSTPAL